MKLTVLGGSAAGGNTGMGCSGYLVQSAETSVVIDLGPGTLLELRKHVDYHMLAAVLISHYHVDHILDLGALRYLLSYNPIPAGRKIPLWIPPNTRNRFADWTATFSTSDEDDFLGQAFVIEEYDPGGQLAVGELVITFAPTVHWVPCWAMRVSDGSGPDLGYGADTGPAADLAGFFTGVGLLISEATDVVPPGGDPATRGHLTATEAAELARSAEAELLMLTHLWEETDVDRAAAEASGVLAKSVLVARPGMTVTL